MAVTYPVRTGVRSSGADVASASYAHPPLVESWLAVDLVGGGEPLRQKAGSLHAALWPEWITGWKSVPNEASPEYLELINVMGDRALRLTAKGFEFGWLGYTGERYPRYEAIRDGFVAVLDAVRRISNHPTEPLISDRWSVRYANRIPQGTVWSTPGDWSFFRLWQPDPLARLEIEPAGFRGLWELPLVAHRGTLTVEFRHVAASSPDEPNCVWINLTAAGSVETGDTSLFDGLDFGRDTIVRSFGELVSLDAKDYWGITARPRSAHDDRQVRPR